MLRYGRSSGLNKEHVITRQFTAIIEREGDGYVSRCPESDIASQGTTVKAACDNLREALELFFDDEGTTG